MTFTAGRACGPRTWRRPTRTRREGTSPAGDRVAVGTVQVGIGTPGLTFIPGDGIFYGPFGWGFYSPWLVYEAPYFAYGYPFGYGPYHRHFGGYRPLYTPRDHPPGSAARSFSGGGRVGSLSRGAFGGPGGLRQSQWWVWRQWRFWSRCKRRSKGFRRRPPSLRSIPHS